MQRGQLTQANRLTVKSIGRELERQKGFLDEKKEKGNTNRTTDWQTDRRKNLERDWNLAADKR